MKSSRLSNNRIIIRLDPGDDVLASIEAICRENKLSNATVNGIGSVESPKLAHYRKDTQKFSYRQLEGIYEITSLIGNVSLVDDQPLAHCHVNVSDEQMQVFGGHLAAGACSATIELVIRDLGTTYRKQLNPDVGLKVWQFDDPSSA